MDTGGDGEKRDVRRPMNAFLIFCKRHRSIVREKNPDLDNRSVTRILGDLWANLKEDEKVVYTDLAKQYKDAFMKANPDYKWHNPEKTLGCQKSALSMSKPTNAKVMRTDMNLLPEGSITPGKLADPRNMGGLSLLLMAGEQSGPVAVTMATKSLSIPSASFKTSSSSALQPETSSSTTLSSALMTATSQPFYTLPSAAFPSSISLTSGTEPRNNDSRTFGLHSGLGPNEVKENRFENLMKNKTESSPVVADGCVRLHDFKRGGKSDEMAMSGVQFKYSNVEKSWENYIPGKNGCLDVLAKAVGETDCRPMKSWETFQSKPLLYQAVAAPKIPQRSLLAEAFKGGYSEILRDNSASSKMANFENQGRVIEDQMNTEIMEQKMVNKIDGKENLTQTLSSQIKSVEEIKEDDKDNDEVEEEESAMVTCGKLVVNHIIDKLYSSELGSGARKANNNNQSDEIDGEQKAEEVGKLESTAKLKTENSDEKLRRKIGAEHSLDEFKIDNKEFMKNSGNATGKGNNGFDVDEKEALKENNDTENFEKITDDNGADNKHETVKSCVTGKKQGEMTSVSDFVEYESEETDDFQPVRKSRRRNRGQRYQELINEGIIQRSKERAAALQQTVPKDESTEDDMQPLEPLNSYILPETAIRRIRKRTTSESAKDKMLHPDDVKRYKTGDFDLEAQIATLPACSIENMGRKRGFSRQRHYSECIHTRRKISDYEHSLHSVPAFDIQKAVSLPPHIKIPSPETSKEPVIGSRKRKARKHSITHMIPAPPTLMNNGKVKTENDSLGPSVIKPTVQVSKDKTDYSGKDLSVPFVKTDYRDHVLGTLGSNRSRSNSDISEKFSDWSNKCELLRDRLLQHKNVRSLSVSEVVNDKTKMGVQKSELNVNVSENKIETGSVLRESRDTSLIQKSVTQSEDSNKNCSVGVVMDKNKGVPNVDELDQIRCDSQVNDVEYTKMKTEKQIGYEYSAESRSEKVHSDGFNGDFSSTAIEKNKRKEEMSVCNMSEVGKDVNSNTTMKS